MAKRERVVCFDLIRFFSCLCVTIVHFNATVSGWNEGGFLYPNSITPNLFLENRLYLGDIGVSLFFILSGATLMMTYKKGNVLLYYKKRIMNIFPMFWLAYACATVIDFLWFKGMSGGDLRYWIFSFLGMDGYLSTFGIVPFSFYKLGEWFLGCIIFIYAIFPLLHMGIEKKPILTCLCAVAIYVLCIDGIQILDYSVCGKEFFMRIPEILMGMLFVKYDLRNKPKLLLLITGLITAVAVVFREQIGNFTLCIAVCAALFAVLAVVGNHIHNEYIKCFLEKISNLTYPVFLVHHWLIDRMVIGFDLANMGKRNVAMMFVIFITSSFFLAHLLSKYSGKLIAYTSKLVSKKEEN